jgi:DNA-binding NtrC family response regulator
VDTMYRAYPKQSRVLVVQRDPALKQSIVDSLENRADGYPLVATASSFKEAKAHLQSTVIDLLITESRLTDTPDFKLGFQDGIALALLAKAKHCSRALFVFDSLQVADITEVMLRVNPIAYIPIRNTTLDPTELAVFLGALQQFETLNKADHNVDESESPFSDRGTAILSIEKSSNLITRYNNAARDWFDLSETDTQPWWKNLGTAKELDHPLSYALAAGIKIRVSPLVMKLANGCERVVTGELTPQNQGDHQSAIVALEPIDNSAIEVLATHVKIKDSVAILGVDHIQYGPNWSEDDNIRFLMDLRSGLLEIVRSEDVVSLPQGNAIAIVLRDLGTEDSLDVCKALLSHLRSVPPHYGDPVSGVRFCLGLAQRSKYPTPLQAIVGGNDAMLAAQLGPDSQRINAASKWDKQNLRSVMYSSSGVFTQNAYSLDYTSFSSELSMIAGGEANTQKFINSVLKLVCQQKGVKKFGIFRKRRDGRYLYIAGGQRSAAVYAHMEEDELSTVFSTKIRNPKMDFLNQAHFILLGKSEAIQPLILKQTVLGLIAVEYETTIKASADAFHMETADLSLIADSLPGLKKSPDAPDLGAVEGSREATPLDTKIDGYVVDNMEGAVDQATFLAKTDIPVAIIGPRGTGKMYVAKIIHQEWGGADDMIVQVDCRDFRSRDEANTRIVKLLQNSEGKTLVFKSPHLMAPDAQVKLARQLSTRTLADSKPPRYLPDAKYVALFPDSMEKLVMHSGLSERLASVFAGYPINVPCVKDRKQAVLRWAHKILSQESAAANRPIKGFTPDAEQALLSHEWPGNISEMRQCIVSALQRTDKEWITPVDLGIFKGISADGVASATDPLPFLSSLDSDQKEEEKYAATALEDLNIALGQAVHSAAQDNSTLPLGAWLEDELILASLDRYQDDQRMASEFLHTKPRNIGRWLPKIIERQEERNSSPIWREPKRFVGEWVRETPRLSEPPQMIVQNMLAVHVAKQCANAKIAVRAKIMGVSVPTYQKRLQSIMEAQEARQQ